MTYPFRILIPMMASVLACGLAASVYGQVPLASIPTNLPGLSDTDRHALEVERKELFDARGRIEALMKAHSVKRVPAETPAADRLRREGVELRAMMTKHIEVSGEFNAKVASLAATQITAGSASVDPMVVDARNVPNGLPKSVDEEIPHTPAGERVRKGIQAIQVGDWKTALAWFQDALNKEPGDPGLQRLVDLAQYTIKRRSQLASVVATTPAKPANNDQIPELLQSTNVRLKIETLAATSVATGWRITLAHETYIKEHGEYTNPLVRIGVMRKAANGEGYSEEELEKQFQKALQEYRQLRKDDPERGRWLGTSEATAEEVSIGGKD